jgi:pyruvate carboxylase
MYPKVLTDFVGIQRKYGPVSVLLKTILKVGEETALNIEHGGAGGHRRNAR